MNRHAHDYTVDLLLEEFNRRKLKNLRYSLRAYARDLGVDSSFLSKVLRGKRILGHKVSEDMRRRLGDEAAKIYPPRNQFKALELDQFRLIADWYHDAILELVHTKDFEPDPKWIADRLNIPMKVAKDAIDRLFRMELLVQGSKGQWFSSGNTYNPPSHVTAPSLQELQIQLLNKAIDAVTSVELSKRDQSSIMMCTDSSKLPEAKERIKRFRRDLMKFLESSDKESKDAVYCLTVSLYPVTNE